MTDKSALELARVKRDTAIADALAEMEKENKEARAQCETRISESRKRYMEKYTAARAEFDRTYRG